MRIRSLQARTFPYDRTHDLYQDFYRRGLREYCNQNGIAYRERSTSRSDSALRRLRRIRDSYRLEKILPARLTTALTNSVARFFSSEELFSRDGLGVYELFFDDGSSVLFAIDARDSGILAAPDTSPFLVYFKTNYWPSLAYPENVLPAANLNPLVAQDLDLFLELRNTPKKTGMFAFFRLWGGADEVEGVEHNLRLIEALAKVPGEKFVNAQLVAGDIAGQAKRLESQGVQWSTTPMPKTELWRRAAESRLNVVRLGMHECVPWRMTDILAMGGCPVIDYGPRTLWPHPLVEGTHFLSLHAPPDGNPPADLPDRVASWLNDPALLDHISRSTAEYFDQHLHPARIGHELMEAVLRRREAPVTSVS